MFKSEGEEEFNSEWIDLSVSECIERREMKKKKSNQMSQKEEITIVTESNRTALTLRIQSCVNRINRQSVDY